MKFSFSEHFSVVGDNITPALLGEAGRIALHSLCALFPYDVAKDFGFESRLSSEEPVCDFFLLIRKSSEGAAIIAGDSSVSAISPELANHPFWQKLSALFREWNRPGTFLNRHIQSFWLEFDFLSDSYNHTPNLFFQVRVGDEQVGKGRWDSRMETALNQIYKILFGIEFPAQLASSMRRCIEKLPAGAILYQTGFMIPRKTEAIRLVITGMKPHDLQDYLRRIDWPGNYEDVKQQESRYLPHFLYAIYDLTIGSGILPDIGMEMFFSYTSQPQWESGWHKVFDLLESDHLLLKEKREGLVNFCGKTPAARIFPVTYYNGINHLKLVSQTGRLPACKGYFGTMIHSPKNTTNKQE